METQNLQTGVKKTTRFYLFIRWKKGVRSYGPPTSTYNGDKYVKDGNPGKELINLLRIFDKDHDKMALALLYDNSVPKYQEERDIVKYCNGIVEANRIHCFQPILEDFPLPQLLK